jgi:Domain of unknown function (DUF4978)
VPDGVLNPRGQNTIAIAVTSNGGAGNGLERVSLTNQQRTDLCLLADRRADPLIGGAPMPSNASAWSRRKFLASAGATAAGSAVMGLTAASGAAASQPVSAAAAGSPISYVDTSESVYDRLTLMSGGRPFFHNGIQFRYDKLKYDHGWTAAQLEPIMAMIAQDGFNVVNIPIWWSMVEPSMNVFKWTDIDLCIDWCAKYGLRLEVLWFGSDSDGTSVGQGARLPSYVTTSYQWVVYQDGSKPMSGSLALLDKTDPRLLARETYVLGQLMSHIAAYDSTNRLVGVQVLNEPNVSHVSNYLGPDRSYSSYSTALWNSGHYTDAGKFRRDVLLNYQTQLGAVVKQSGHSVYTRSNLVGDAWPIAENEALRAKGTNSIDFYGNDPYTTDTDRLYNYGTDSFWAQGKNFPMMMENYVGNQASVPQKFSAIAGGAVLNFYAAVHPDVGSSDNEALYNYDTRTHVVTRKAATYVIADLNTALNKISTDLASRKPIDVGGKTLQTYNRKAAASVNLTKPVGSYSFTYATTASGQAFAVQRAATEFALVSTQTGTFTLPTSIGSVTSMQTGSYNANDVWVGQGPKSYTISGSTIVVKLAKNECVRVVVS